MKSMFVADDGSIFETQEAAERYEAESMGKRELVKQWVEDHYKNHRVTQKNLNVILVWESWRNSVLQAVPEVELEAEAVTE